MKAQFGKSALAGAMVLAFSAPAQAALVTLVVTVENLSPTNSTSFAPLHFGVGNGTFDAFNTGSTAGPAIVTIAEGGSGSLWLPAFAAADPMATISTIGMALTPGQSRSSGLLTIDTSLNRFFTFASMVIPSNDLFIGNDNPAQYLLFDMAGNQLINQITLTANQIWDANSEIADPLAAAFVVGGTNSLRTAENGVVAFDRSELNAFNGVTTAAGYTFSNAGLTNTSPIYRISFASAAAVPEPTTWAMMIGGFAMIGGAMRSRVRKPAFA
jgi:PEP-CTERM motif